jgi:hypothetical protein
MTNKIDIPKSAMNIATKYPTNTWCQDREKFVSILQNYYPHLTYKECVDKFVIIKTRLVNIDYYVKDNNKQKTEMLSIYKEYNTMKSYISDDYYGVLQSKYNNIRNRILNNNTQLNSVGINTNEPPEYLNKAYRYIYSSNIENNNQVFVIFFVLISCLALFFFLM